MSEYSVKSEQKNFKKKVGGFDSRLLALLMTRLHVGTGPVPLVPLPASPLLNPPGRGVQGLLKDDWVTVWILYRFIFFRQL